jgi:beta-galactosidase
LAHSIELRDGAFVLNGEKTFLYGAEVHYFRVPRDQWEDRILKVKAAGCNLISTYIPWLWHEPEEGAYDLTGKTRPERDLDSFLSLVEQHGLWCVVRPGPYVMSELKREGIPGWLPERYPEVVSTTRNGEPNPSRVITYMHPIYLEKTRAWYAQVMPVIRRHLVTQGGRVIMVQLCNEVGMLHWVTNSLDWSPVVLERYGAYLTERFGTVAEINAVFGTSASSLEEFLRGFRQLTCPAARWEWARFWRRYLKDYLDSLRSMAVAEGIDVPFLVNVHGFKDFSVYSRGVDYPIGVSQLYRTPEIADTLVAGDFYPGRIGYDTYHDLVLATELTAAIQSPTMPRMSAEFQSGRLMDRPRVSPQDLDLNTRTCVAHGLNGLNYYMFAAGENWEDIGLFSRRHEWQAPLDSKGNPRLSYPVAARLGKLFRTFGPALVEAPKQVVTYLGFYPDYYMTEEVTEVDREAVQAIAGLRESVFFDGVARLLTLANLHYTGVDLLRASAEELAKLPSLWVFAAEQMDRPVQEKLLAYVLSGGSLILFPGVPTRNLDGSPCTVLKDGLRAGEGRRVSAWNRPTILGWDSVFTMGYTLYPHHQGETIATCDGQPCGFKVHVGRGQAIVLGVDLSAHYDWCVDVLTELAAAAGVVGRWSCTDRFVSVVERAGADASFLFVTNYDEIPHSGQILRDGQVLLGGTPVWLAPRSGLMLPLNVNLSPGMVVRYSTAEILSYEGGCLQVAGTTESVAEICLEGASRVEGNSVLDIRREGRLLKARVAVSNDPVNLMVGEV